MTLRYNDYTVLIYNRGYWCLFGTASAEYVRVWVVVSMSSCRGIQGERPCPTLSASLTIFSIPRFWRKHKSGDCWVRLSWSVDCFRVVRHVFALKDVQYPSESAQIFDCELFRV